MARILIIDDDPMMREALSTALVELYDVQSAGNGELGVQLATSFQPDLIICDISMPHMDGFAVLQHCQAIPTLADVPFVFLSGNSDQVTVRQGMIQGADDFVAKPFSLEELYHVIKIRLEKRAKRQTLLQDAIEELRVNISSSIPHELRTAIGIIEGYAGLVLEDTEETNPVQREMMEAIRSNAQRLHLMAEKYLWYLKTHVLESLPPNGAATQVDKIVTEIALDSAKRFERFGDLHLNLQSVDLQIAPDYIRKIAEEVIENAFKFSTPGSPVSVSGLFEGRNYVLRIIDQGHGMTLDQISKIGAFMQFDRKEYEQKGTGLGLIIARRLSELSGGQLNIQSSAAGTCVVVGFPAVNAPASAPA